MKTFYKKGFPPTQFTDRQIELMRQAKAFNGWSEDINNAVTPDANTATKKPQSVADYQTLYERAKGFEKDGKFADALVLFEQCKAIKNAPHLAAAISRVKGKQEKASKQREKNAKDSKYNEAFTLAQAEEKNGNYDGSRELYLTAQEYKNTKKVRDAIDKVDAKLTKQV